MSKYKVGDKVVMEITDEISVMEEPDYILSDATVVNKGYIDKAAEPLSTYTEPLEAKISRQAAEITRLLEENKELKEDKAVLNAKIDAYKLYGDQHEEECNQTFNKGAEMAWELARKIVLKNGYSAYDLHEIFNCCGSHQALEDFTYPEAAAKVAEWEKTKEEIKAGDVVESNNGNGERIAVIDVWPSFDGLHFEGISSNGTLTIDASAKYYTKTGRHIDIDSFLKQIRGEKE